MRHLTALLFALAVLFVAGCAHKSIEGDYFCAKKDVMTDACNSRIHYCLNPIVLMKGNHQALEDGVSKFTENNRGK